MFEVKLNDVSVWKIVNTTPKKYEKVKVMAGSDWFKPVDGQIRRLTIKSKAA